MNYLSSFTFLFKYPNWGMTMLIGVVMNLIPFAGPIVVHGWSLELMKLRIEGDEETLPELSFDRFGDLFNKGLQPFLASIALLFPFMFILYFTMAIFIALMTLISVAITGAAGAAMGEVGAIVGVIVSGLICLILAAAMMMILWSLGVLMGVAILRVEITGEFSSIFALGPLKENVSAMFKPLLVGNIVYGFGSMALIILGYISCFIGLWPAMFLLQTAGSEIRTIVYRDYLAKGNAAITM